MKFIPNKPGGFDGNEDYSKILQQLSNLGANYQTIYPDLDGFCKSIGFEIIKKIGEKNIEEESKKLISVHKKENSTRDYTNSV